MLSDSTGARRGSRRAERYSATADSAYTEVVASPMPGSPSFGRPQVPWMKTQLRPAFTAIEAIVMRSRACGRRMPTVNWRIAWNHRHGSSPGAVAYSTGFAASTTSGS